MKLFLATVALAALSADAFTFAPSTPQHSTALFASKSAVKQMKREKWVESRGGSNAPTSDSSAASDLEKNDSGLTFKTLTSPNGSTATIYTLGACVTSYSSSGTEYLAVRPDAKMDGSKPISGGLAFCWPQFGPDSGLEGLTLQQHGFARNTDWKVASTTDESVTMTMEPDDYITGMGWEHPFKCEYTVSINDDSLDTTFKVSNTGDGPFNHQAALHSYFKVSSLANLQISGSFKGKEYIDKMDGATKKTEERDALTITSETDSVYMGVNDPAIEDTGTGKKLSVQTTSGWEDCVVWNPYGDEGMGFDNFVCAESVKFEPVTTGAGESWEAKMSLKPSDL